MCYTDIPMVVSHKHVAIIDPHMMCVHVKAANSPAGAKKELSSFFKHKSHVSTFESVFGLDTRQSDGYNGTIFRFPLRQKGSNSEISDTVYSPEMIHSLLFESLKEESPYLLLFLQNVKCISLMEWRNGSPKANEIFRVELFETEGQHAQRYTKALEKYVEVKNAVVHVTDFTSTNKYHRNWLIVKACGSDDPMLVALGNKLSILPWVGLATQLPLATCFSGCKIKKSVTCNNYELSNVIFEELKPQLIQARQSVTWTHENVASDSGHAFCFLPLPERTAMPVHIQGYFAVADNRRSIKWPAHDENGKEAQWNKELLYKMVAPSYALLLACRTCLIHYDQSPLPVTAPDHVSDAYAAWPLYKEVKNVHIWSELVSPTLELCLSLPLLWTPASGGRWVQFSEAYFLPGLFCTNSYYNCSPVIIQILIKLGVPVVSLPECICETIKQSEQLAEVALCQEISPRIVRMVIKDNPQCCTALLREEVYDVLDYILHDLVDGTYYALVGIPMLPLKDVSTPVRFEILNDHNCKYIFTAKQKALVDVLPGANNVIVDPEIPEEAAKKLSEIARTCCLQLKEVNDEIMCVHLLPISLWHWCKEKKGPGWMWIPDKDLMPSQSWMHCLWKWISVHSVSLSRLQGLPIVPLLETEGDKITLVEPTSRLNLCSLSVTFSPKDEKLLTCILKKLGFLIVAKSMMHSNESNIWMNDHPDFKEYIPELSPGMELVIQYFDKLSITTIVQKVKKLDSIERDFIRRQFSSLCDSFAKYRSCLRFLPIYPTNSTYPHTYIAIEEVGVRHHAFLPPDNIISPLPDYPKKMLQPNMLIPEERAMLRMLNVKQLSISELCNNHLIPLVLEYIHKTPCSWSVGDDLLLWILKLQRQLEKNILLNISQYKIILSCNSVHMKPEDLIDPHDSTLQLLYSTDSEVDKNCFADERYFQDSQCRKALLLLGMKNWETFQNNSTLLRSLLLDRMKTITSLTHSNRVKRSECILRVLAGSHSLYNDSILLNVPFLLADPLPPQYPMNLKEKWHGQETRLYTIKELYPASGHAHDLIGTVGPILSHEYHFSRYTMSLSAIGKLAFKKVTEQGVLFHLNNLESSLVSNEDVEKFDRIVMSVYEYLYNNSFSQKLRFIWWKDTEVPRFIPANHFVLELPESLKANLEPYYYHLKIPVRKYANLFQLHDILTAEDVASVIRSIGNLAEGKRLTSVQMRCCASLLSWLCEKRYNSPSTLMLTEHCNLVPAEDCVFDDRNWIKQSQVKDHINTSSLCFVHDSITPKVAKHFKVNPLSHKIFPSHSVGIRYTQVGQHEEITHRINQIVQDYETDIDVFKELIQNADDAGASEVKFLIDWRQHPKESLIVEDLKEWQGPALMVYNNATFSDEDFDNICKVAGETKKHDPFKIGRFGVGFCATYHLTDLPSFVSRKYFTMFDSHTFYLGDRISANAPGMRVDIVKNNARLKLYYDQFLPYNNVFGCDIFDLNNEGYPGTLFRFPFRTAQTSRRSKICKRIYEKRKVDNLVRALREQGNLLLLFLKHIKKVSVFELNEGCSPSDATEIFSIQCSRSDEKRLNLMKSPKCVHSCITTVNITVCDSVERKQTESTWFLSSSVKDGPSDLRHCSEASGLLPLAEVAIKVATGTNQKISCIPISDFKCGKVFCFLPLPIKSCLPFHVNGFFSIGKSRRNVLATDDKSFGSLWNQSIAEGALVEAFVFLLTKLSTDCRDLNMCDSLIRQEYLSSYYSLWKVSGASDLISRSFSAAFNKVAPELEKRIIWSAANGGSWLSPKTVVVFRDSTLCHKAIKDNVEAILLYHCNAFVDIPDHVYEAMRESLINSGRILDYKHFCLKILFPKFSTVDMQARNRNILFLLEQHGAHFGKGNQYDWAEKFLSKQACIPCKQSSKLRPVTELIDPSNKLFMNLFDVSEGRFPSEELQNSPKAMHSLRSLGMTSSELGVIDLKERAELVAKLHHKQALKHSINICKYISLIYCSESQYGSIVDRKLKCDQQKALSQLANTAFLPVKEKPCEVDVTWCGKFHSFKSPSELYSAEYESLVFSQCPIVEGTYSEVYKCLGITSRKPSFRLIINHLQCVISTVVQCKSKPSDGTIKFLNRTMKAVYEYLHMYHSSPEEVKQLRSLGTFIWQDGCFLSPNQVVVDWKCTCAPYLCELSRENKPFTNLYGIHNEATLDMLVQVLKKIAADYGDISIPERLLEFVEFISRQLEKRMLLQAHPIMQKLYIPDKDRVMRDTSDLFVNESFSEKNRHKFEKFLSRRSAYFIHSSIPLERAVKLGVKRLSHSIFTSHSIGIKYTQVGQHEEITHRIKQLVEDYETDIDIFKELIQNADDAGATEIKFLIDWRQHPKETLITEELKEWQGPALIVYNNATFSDEDLDNICKVAGETKKHDPFKIGRFGVGFCATYQLTDLPSFVSRKYFTMFDSHTFYLGDRISANAPGMRVDIVENKDSLHLYHDQFVPYSDLFGCKIFDLSTEGYPGTLFRFPFRTAQTSKKSKICKSIYSKRKVDKLVCALVEQGDELLIFLKHVNKVQLFILDEEGSPSDAREVFTVKCNRGDSRGRLELMTSVKHRRHCFTKINVEVCNEMSNERRSSAWALSSAIATSPSDILCRPEAKGLLPLAETAVRIHTDAKQEISSPLPEFKCGKVFCFLPLPVKCSLPFHINGFFSIGKDRRNILATDDESFGSLWNQFIAKGALIEAFIYLLTKLCTESKDLGMCNTRVKLDFLSSYYSLWKFGETSDVISRSFAGEFYRRAPMLTSKLIWSEINGGCWMDPQTIIVYRDSTPNHKVMEAEAKEMLLTHGLGVADIPDHVYEALKMSLARSDREFNYKKFCFDFLFPNFCNLHARAWNRNILFLLEQHGAHFGSGNQYDWAEKFLCKQACIPCKRSDKMRPIAELIDPSSKLFKNLFDVSEGRFPSEELQSSPKAIHSLRRLGMATELLNIADLKKKAKSVTGLEHKKAIERSQNVCEYLSSIYKKYQSSKNTQYADALKQIKLSLDIPFLPVKEKPHEIALTWCGQFHSFKSPSELYSAEYESLVFSQCPVVEGAYTDVYMCLGITSKKPTFQLMIKHLQCVISTVVQCKSKPSDGTIKFLDRTMKAVYEYLHVYHSSPEEVKQLRSLGTFIWQDGCFLSPNQVVVHWKCTCAPYLCELSRENKPFTNLYGIHNEATLDMLVQVLKNIRADYMDMSIPDRLLEFVQFTSGQLEKGMLREQAHPVIQKLYLPDKDRVMRDTSDLFANERVTEQNKHKFEKFLSHRSAYFIHDSIPLERALKLGVKRLSHSIFTSHSIGIKYTQVGQHEEITHRIKQLVEDYETDIDIFKELIQNADDAGATEIKFLIDWRQHPKETLITEELKEWQGPALIVYNNAAFSDEDFDNICKVAGETKKHDPFKIGRFGVGFCATYHLTDLPSFVSRKYFTMFDSHTFYLGDRISANAPGMRVDIVENKDSLHLYHDQFVPYSDLFGCKIFDLSTEGYPGTLFRFPFRTAQTSKKSKVCKSIYSKRKVDRLVCALIEQGDELLVFLKHVNKVQLLVLDEESSPSDAREVFSVKCNRGDSRGRLELMTSVKHRRQCFTKINVQVCNEMSNERRSSAWALSSAIATSPSDILCRPEAKGLLPLAETAVRIYTDTKQGIRYPVPECKCGQVFSFLPLPIKSSLPFHINGFFSVGKDRRNILATDDNSFGSLWNQFVARGALVEAFINLLTRLIEEFKDFEMCDLVIKQEYLKSYYSLWKFSGASDLISRTFSDAFYKLAPELEHKIVWSLASGGCWLSPKVVVVFRDSTPNHKMIESEAKRIMLDHKYYVADLPDHVYDILKTSLSVSNRVFSYKEFCLKILFHNFCNLDASTWGRNILFLLEQHGSHFGKGNQYDWAENFLRNQACIPCKQSSKLKEVTELIDPSNKLFESLFHVSEGRFPNEELLKSSQAKHSLKHLGMTHTKLSISDLEERARSVTKLDHKQALDRSRSICDYIASIYGDHWYGWFSSSEQRSTLLSELKELLKIEFLPVKEKPSEVDVTWCGKFHSFKSPSELYSAEYESLVFSQCPVVGGAHTEVYKCLGITSNKPSFQLIINHLQCVISTVVQCKSKPSDATIKFLDRTMKAVYEYLHVYHSSPEEVKQLRSLGTFIWQDGYFLSPNQVVAHWKFSCIPYLCQLSSKYKRVCNFLGVCSEATIDMLILVLQNVAQDHNYQPVHDDILSFVEYVSARLEEKILLTACDRKKLTIYLPDCNKVMRISSALAENVSAECITNSEVYRDFISSEAGHIVHKNIPRERAINLGVNPLLDAVLGELEDQNFLKGTEFEKCVDECICDQLNALLKDCPSDSILNDFIRMADNAEVTEVIFVLDHRVQFPNEMLVSSSPKWKSLQSTPALCIINNKKYTDADINQLAELRITNCYSRGTIGFNVAYQVTDCPSFVSYDRNRAPECLCVFDPTRLFVPHATKWSPGRKWTFKEDYQQMEFSDQFKPYLQDDLSGLLSLSSSRDIKRDEFVVFRLPFTRSTNSSKLRSEHMFDLSSMSSLFKRFSETSRDVLLFLSHVRSLSMFEIKTNGSVICHFTSNASITSSSQNDYETFSKQLKVGLRKVSLAHVVRVSHERCKCKQDVQWIVQRASDKCHNERSNSTFQQYVCGVAAPLKLLPNDDFKLFSSLPLPIVSDLPVHINGNFLLDTSGKHLKSKVCEGFPDWNKSLVENVIVPAYVDLIISVSKLDMNIIPGFSTVFHSLFPNRALAKAIDEEVISLNIFQLFFKELLKRNPAILMLERPCRSLACNWINVKSCLFCVPFESDKMGTNLTVCPKLRSALVSLGLEITSAPNHIYYGCTFVESSYTISARVSPEKVVKHLQCMELTEETKGVLKTSNQLLLEYCISGYNIEEIPSLFKNALFLIAQDGSLQRNSLFESRFSALLPHRADKFVDCNLEKCKAGERLKLGKAICPLPLEFVSQNITLPSNCEIDSLQTITLLWEYLVHDKQLTADTFLPQLTKHFLSKAIIPAVNNKFYPLRLSKTLVRHSSANCDNCQVMKKLGYVEIDFTKIGLDDTRNLNCIINSLTSCFKHGEDIISCFKLCEPPNLTIQLSDNEAISFASSLGSATKKHVQDKCKVILRFPLFYRADGRRISLHGINKVFILTSNDVKLDGIPVTKHDQVILKHVASKEIHDFYEKTIPKKMSTYLSVDEFYVQMVLPSLQTLEAGTVKKHIEHLYIHRETVSGACAVLKRTAFVRHNGQFYKVSDLYDHRVEFFNTFMCDHVLPPLWRDRMEVMVYLGLQTTVSKDEWLNQSKTFSQEKVDENTEHRSNVLLNQLINITKLSGAGNTMATFLQAVANIKFLHSSDSCELSVVLSHLFPVENSSVHKKVKFHGAVIIQEANKACLCKASIPRSCEYFVNHATLKQALSIEHPVLSKTIAENLKHLCRRISMNCARTSNYNRKHINKLIDILEEHYRSLNEENLPNSVLCTLKDEACILRSKNQLLQLVKPSQLVLQLPQGCNFEPYCYAVTPWLEKYVDFLVAIGVKKELKSQDYIGILTCIHEELKDERGASASFKSVIEIVYRELVLNLRKEKCLAWGDNSVIYLPDESTKLVRRTDLYLNDVPWYRSRLPAECDIKIILHPPVDDKGHHTLPEVLRIKPLSDVVAERMKDSCKSPDFKCNDEELFLMGRRSESGRCVFVRNIYSTLRSDELFNGLCRMYYTEYKCPPTRSFKTLAKRLKNVKIQCISTAIKTELCFKNQAIPGTDSTKLCHLAIDKKAMVLYISPHCEEVERSGSLSMLLRDLSSCVRKLLNNEIKNAVPIAAVFECLPRDIPEVLSREQVCEYIQDSTPSQKQFNIGSPVPWKHVAPQDSLVVLNFNPGDSVYYICDDGSLINAEVVRHKVSRNSDPFELLTPSVLIRVKENQDRFEIAGDDDGGSGSDSDEYYSASESVGDKSGDEHSDLDDETVSDDDSTNLAVSPMQVISILSVSQRKSLWHGYSSPYACPLTLASIPVEERVSLEQWLVDLYRSPQFNSHSQRMQLLMSLRLLAQLYYQLLMHKKSATIINKVSDIIKGSVSFLSEDQATTCIQNLLAVITKQVPHDVEKIFPTEALGQILDHRVQNPTCLPSIHPSSAISVSLSRNTSSVDNHGFSQTLSGLFVNMQHSVSNIFTSRAFRRGNRVSQVHSLIPETCPQPNVCMSTSMAWLLQAKTDFCAARSLMSHETKATPMGVDAHVTVKCSFPALVCFLCHDAVEKSIKGILYAFCGLRQDLVNCSNLMMLYDTLNTSTHCPKALVESISLKECVMVVNRHENKSRFPNYQSPPCAPASFYNVEDAKEAYSATKSLLDGLQTEERFHHILGNLDQVPTVTPTAVFQSIPDNEGT